MTRPTLPQRKTVPYRRRLLLLGAGVVTLLAAGVLSHWRGLGEILYGSWLGPWISYGLARASSRVPFSLADGLLVGFALRQLTAAARGLWSVRQGQEWRSVAAAGALRLGQDLGVAVLFFYVLWGFQYARPSLEERWGWETTSALDADFLPRLALEMVAETNAAYLQLHGVDDRGAPTPPSDRASIDACVEAGYRAIAQGWSACAVRDHGRTKRPWLSPLLDRLGISGFYFPFTGEANVNRGLPGAVLPQTTAHEKAHQRGFAPEDEANFVGFLAGYASGDPLARYSALLFAQRQLLRTLARSDPDRTADLVGLRVPGVQRDVDAIVAYWARYRGRAQRISNAVNDAYLRSNRVEGGVQSYAGSADLILRWALQGRNTTEKS